MARNAIVVFLISVAGIQLVFGSTKPPDTNLVDEAPLQNQLMTSALDAMTTPPTDSKLTMPPGVSDVTPPSDVMYATFTDHVITLDFFTMPTSNIPGITQTLKPPSITEKTTKPPSIQTIHTDPSMPPSLPISHTITTMPPIIQTFRTEKTTKPPSIQTIHTDPTPLIEEPTHPPTLVIDPTPLIEEPTYPPTLVIDPTPLIEEPTYPPTLVIDPTPLIEEPTYPPTLVIDPTPLIEEPTKLSTLVTDPTPVPERSPTPIVDYRLTQTVINMQSVSSYDKQTPLYNKMTTSPPYFELGEEEKMQFSEAVEYDKTSMFDEEGNVAEGLAEQLGPDVRQILQIVKAKYGRTLDLKSLYGDGTSRADDVKGFFLRLYKGMTSLDKLLNDSALIQTSDELDYNVIVALNRTVKEDSLRALPEAVKDKICEDFQNGNANIKIIRNLLRANWTDCVASLSKFGQKPEGDLARVLADAKRTAKPVPEWTGIDWNKAITDGYLCGLPTDLFKLIPAPVVKNRLSDIKTQVTDARKLKIITNKLSEARSNSILKPEDIQNMDGIIKDISAKEFEEMDKADVLLSLETLAKNADELNAAQRTKISKNIQSTDITPTNLPDALKYINKKMLKEVESSDFVTALSEIGSVNVNAEMSRNVLNKLRESPDYDEPSDLTNTKFKEMGAIAKGLTPKNIKDASNLDFSTLVADGDIQNIDLPRDTGCEVVKRFLADSGKTQLTANDVSKLGKNVKALTVDVLDINDPDVFATTLESMKDTIAEVAHEMYPTTKSAIVSKIVQNGGDLGSNLEKLGSLLQDVPVTMLRDKADTEFGDLTGSTKRYFNCSEDETCPELYKKVSNIIGRPGLDNMRNYTTKVMKNLGKVMCGMPLEDLLDIHLTNDLIDIANVLNTECDLNIKKKEVLKEKVRSTWDVGSSSQTPLTLDDLYKVSALLPHFDISELESFGEDVCLDIVEIIGDSELDDIPNDKVKNFASFALKCLGKQTGALTSDDLDTLGKLVTVVVVERSDDIDASTVTETVAISEPTFLSSTGKKKMMQLVKKDMDLATEGYEFLSIAGGCIPEISDEDKMLIPDDSWASAGPDIIDSFDKSEDKYDKRQFNGVGETTKNRKARAEKMNKVMTTIKDAVMITANSAARRRRSVTSLSCSDMQSLGSGVVSMTTAELEAMADSDFLDCASFLGGTSTWNTDQIASLLTVAIRAGTFGDANTWSADDVTDAGIIVQALTSSEITTFTDLDLNAMSSIGQHEGWGETQLSAGFSRWLSLSKGDDMSTVDSTDLIGLGHFACGASTSHITSLSTTEYSYAARYIGELTSCTASQLVAYCDLAQTVFGAISTWDTSIISEVGSVIGGLTANEISSLTAYQIAVITPTSISQIPASSFVGFTVAQIKEFTVAQAQATTSNQQAGLSQAQLDALIAAGASVESSMNVVQASGGMLVVSCMVALLAQTLWMQ